jgi:hypothetical protein
MPSAYQETPLLSQGESGRKRPLVSTHTALELYIITVDVLLGFTSPSENEDHKIPLCVPCYWVAEIVGPAEEGCLMPMVEAAPFGARSVLPWYGIISQFVLDQGCTPGIISLDSDS